MNDELHSNDWIADDLLTVLAESREIPITGVAPVESAEPSDEPTEADRKQSNETIDEPTRRDPTKKRVPVKQHARVPWTATLIDAFCCIAIFCAVATSLYALARDFSPKPLTRSQSLTSASAPENVVTQESALAENSAPNVLNAPTVSEEPPIEITTDAAPESDLAIDSNAVEETIANNENAAPESDLAIDSNAIAETIANNENAVKNVEPDETPIPDATPLSENTLASNPAIKSNHNSENVKPKETPPAPPQIYTKKICDVKIGERAVGTNPQGANPLESDDTIFERVKHYGYKLSYQKANGTYCHINLLRPEDWLEYAEIQLRGKNSGRVLEELDFQIAEFSPLNFFDYDDCVPEIWLELPEMGVVGWAKLEDVDKNVSVQPGPGNVVTGTFAHISDDVIDLLIEDQDKPIGCTTNHPFWSVDRQDFVDAGDLLEGERVQLYNGETKRVVIKLPRPGPQNVYNLEIYSEHAYRVTRDGVLVHNLCREYDVESEFLINYTSLEDGANIEGEIHHICSIYYAPMITLFKRCNVNINGFWNKMRVIGHKGPHGNYYNTLVYDQLEKEVNEAEARAFLAGSLNNLSKEEIDILVQKRRNIALKKALTKLRREILYGNLGTLVKAPSVL